MSLWFYCVIKIKNMIFVERETLCDSAVTDKDFDFHVVNAWVEQYEAVVQLDHTLPIHGPLDGYSLTKEVCNILFKTISKAEILIAFAPSVLKDFSLSPIIQRCDAIVNLSHFCSKDRHPRNFFTFIIFMLSINKKFLWFLKSTKN